MYRIVILVLATLLPIAAFGQKREILDLQRDLANLSADVKNVQRSVDEKMGELRALVNQNIEASKQSTATVAGLESKVKDQVSAPMATMNTRIDQMSGEFQSLRESVTDLNSRMTKIQAQLEDIGNTLKVMQAPPAPPPTVQPGQSGAPGAAASGPPAGMSAPQLYDSAMRDRSGGQLDLALQGFNQFLQYYGSTELAPNAQFYVGQIHYDRNEYPQALEAFDAVLERYSENNKTPDAMYMKGMTLLRSGQRNQAATEFLNVIEKYPSSEVAEKAKAQRKALGLSAAPSTSTSKSKKRR